MGAMTAIQWVSRTLPDGTFIPGHSFNPWWGCLKVSEECKNCYALDIATKGPTRYDEQLWGPAATTGRRLSMGSGGGRRTRFRRPPLAGRRTTFTSAMSRIEVSSS